MKIKKDDNDNINTHAQTSQFPCFPVLRIAQFPEKNYIFVVIRDPKSKLKLAIQR